MSDGEELVAVSLGNDYYLGNQFSTVATARDYMVPRSTLERWEAAMAAYEAMQAEIDTVMDEQRERIRALRAQEPESPIAKAIQEVYASKMAFTLGASPLLRGLKHKEPKGE